MGFGKVNEIEVDAFREEKSTRMSLCFTTVYVYNRKCTLKRGKRTL